MSINQILDKHFAGRTFEVYAIATGKALSKPASFSATHDKMEWIGSANGSSNGLDVREKT